MERVKLFTVFIKEDGDINLEFDASIKELNIPEDKLGTLLDENKLIDLVSGFVSNLDEIINKAE